MVLELAIANSASFTVRLVMISAALTAQRATLLAFRHVSVVDCRTEVALPRIRLRHVAGSALVCAVIVDGGASSADPRRLTPSPCVFFRWVEEVIFIFPGIWD